VGNLGAKGLSAGGNAGGESVMATCARCGKEYTTNPNENGAICPDCWIIVLLVIGQAARDKSVQP
jgi:hypothetical protein